MTGRTRTIKAEFFQSPSLSTISRDARLLFVGLWTAADDAGRGRAEVAILRGMLFALDDDVSGVDVDRWLHELADSGHIVRYTVDGRQFFEVVNFAKHQAAAYRRGESRLPAPPESVQGDASCTQLHTVARNRVLEVEVEVEVENNCAPLAAPPGRPARRPARPAAAPRPRNELWDALTAAFGEPATATEKTNRGRHVRELTDAGATATEVAARVVEHANRRAQRRPGWEWDLTANALVSRWSDLAPGTRPAGGTGGQGALVVEFAGARVAAAALR